MSTVANYPSVPFARYPNPNTRAPLEDNEIAGPN